MLDICLLGCGGMVPLPDRRLTSMLIRQNGKMILVDCGEGTQIGIKLLGWGFKQIEALCLTHYHADHVAGLPGFLLTLGNSGRTDPFTIFGPPPLAYIINSLTVIAPQLPFDILLAELSELEQSDGQIGDIIIKAIPMDHRIPCLSYSFEVKRAGKFERSRAEELGIPIEFWRVLQKGDTVGYQGREFTPDMVTGPQRKGLKVTYCTDSRPTAALAELADSSDLLILEGMYGDDALLHKAVEWKHMIFSEAAAVAAQSKSKELWLTHFSPSVKNPETFLSIAQDIFPCTRIGSDLLTTKLTFADR